MYESVSQERRWILRFPFFVLTLFFWDFIFPLLYENDQACLSTVGRKWSFPPATSQMCTPSLERLVLPHYPLNRIPVNTIHLLQVWSTFPCETSKMTTTIYAAAFAECFEWTTASQLSAVTISNVIFYFMLAVWNSGGRCLPITKRFCISNWIQNVPCARKYVGLMNLSSIEFKIAINFSFLIEVIDVIRTAFHRQRKLNDHLTNKRSIFYYRFPRCIVFFCYIQ